MFRHHKKNLFVQLTIGILFLGALMFCLLKILPARAQEQIKIFPTVYATYSLGDLLVQAPGAKAEALAKEGWENPQFSLNQDLDPNAPLANFNSQNSASPFAVSNNPDQQSRLPLAQFFKRIFTLFKITSAQAQDQGGDDLPPLPLINDLPLIDDNSNLNNNVASTTTEDIITPILENTEAPTIRPEVITTTSTQEILPSAPLTETKVLELSNFDLGNNFSALGGSASGGKNQQIQNVQLMLSFAGKVTTNDKLQIDYFYQGSWQNAGELNLEPEKEVSNATNGGYFLFALPIFTKWEDLGNLKVRFVYQANFSPRNSAIFLDSAWLEVDYNNPEEIKEQLKTVKHLGISGKSVFSYNENPEFDLTLPDQNKNQGLFEKVVSLFNRTKIKTTLINPDGQKSNEEARIKGNKINISKKDTKNFKPGLYKLIVTADDNGEEVSQKIDFAWGVLAINVNKSIYVNSPLINTNNKLNDTNNFSGGEVAYIQMGVLSNYGRTICDANLRLEITTPKSETKILTTENGEIKYSPTCGQNNVTDFPDYFAYYKIDETGTYKMKLVNLDNKYEIEDSFEARESVPFEVERIGATRINPFSSTYVMHFKIKANQDFNGTIREHAPEDFEITEQKGMRLKNNNGAKEIIWQKQISAGESIDLNYEFQAPKISPQFYLLGPLEMVTLNIGDQLVFSEARQWQIAADATNMLLFWAGSGGSCSGAGAPPTGWILVNDGSFTAVFPRGDATYTANEGGSATHTHTANGAVTGISGSATRDIGGSTDISNTHTHTISVGGVTASNSLPLYKDLCVIKLSAGGIPTGPTAIPQNVLTIFDATVPSGWSDYSSTFGTYFIRGNTTPGGTSGSNTHDPGHTVTGTLTANSSGNSGPKNTGYCASLFAHTHTFSLQSTDTPSIQPLSQNIILGQKTTSAGPIPNGMIAMFDGDPGADWIIKSGVAGDFNTKYLKVTGAYGNNASGATTHTHSQISGNSNSYTATDVTANNGTLTNIDTHYHTMTLDLAVGTNTNLPPYTDVVIAKALVNALPAWASNGTCGGSYPCENPASTTTTPTNEGSAVTFIGTATDDNNDQWKLLICKTNGTTGTDCDGGASDRWCVSSSFVNSGLQNTCAYTTLNGDIESNIWYAHACDSTGCSVVGHQGSGGSGSPFEVNHDSAFTVFSDNSPINPDGVVTFSTTADDPDTGDQITLYVCKTASFTAPSTCNGGAWCNSSAVASDPSCQYDDADNILQDNTWGAYGYIVDDHGLVASGGQQGVDSVMTISNVAPSITASSIDLRNTGGETILVPSVEQNWTTGFKVHFIVTDYNSCVNVSSTNEIASAITNVYRSGITQSGCDIDGEDNNNNCYANAQVGNGGSCYQNTSVDPCNGASDATVGWTCEFALQYHVDPTVATNTQYPDDTWLTSVKATDDDSDPSTLVETDTGREMDKFSSYDLNTASVAYGSVAPDNESSNVTSTLEATGNVGLDAEYSGTDMTYSTSTPILVSQQKYDLTGGKAWADMDYTLSVTSTPQELNCPKTIVSLSPKTKDTFFKLKVPAGQSPGDYTGTDTFLGVEGESAGW